MLQVYTILTSLYADRKKEGREKDKEERKQERKEGGMGREGKKEEEGRREGRKEGRKSSAFTCLIPGKSLPAWMLNFFFSHSM